MKKGLLFSMFGLMLSLTAKAGNPVAQMKFRAMDDSGNVVTGAPVTASTFLRWVPGSEFGHDEYDQAKGVTDTNGVVVLTLPSKTGNVRYSILAEGTYFDNMNKMKVGDTAYYRDKGDEFRFTNVVDGRWQPWNPTVELLLKPVLNPIPMYARHLESRRFPIPAYNTALGYDLVKSDWLSPYGKGETADFIFRLDCQLGEVSPDEIQYFDATLSLSFSNEYDGIQEFLAHPRKGSAMRSPRFAPESGYQTQWLHRAFAHKSDSYYEHDEKQNYFFRIRTKKNDKGMIISALYGKLYGPIHFGVYVFGAKMQMKYYLNPTPNDRNMEFDPSKNLFTDLKPAEQVHEP